MRGGGFFFSVGAAETIFLLPPIVPGGRSRKGAVPPKKTFAKNQLPLICKERDRLFGCWRKVVFPFKLDSNDDLTPAMRKPGTRPPSFLYGSFPRRVSRRAGGFFYRGLGADET